MPTVFLLSTNDFLTYNHNIAIVLHKEGKSYNYGIVLRGTKWQISL
jgi:hypothetical protein